MITNFKIFENDYKFKNGNYKSKIFWCVANDEYFEIRLFKIGLTIDEIKRKVFIIQRDQKIYNKFFYFGYTKTEPHWLYATEFSKGSFDDYNFVGNVEINEDDILKYKLNKYNI
jgi:hypothetical protein